MIEAVENHMPETVIVVSAILMEGSIYTGYKMSQLLPLAQHSAHLLKRHLFPCKIM